MKDVESDLETMVNHCRKISTNPFEFTVNMSKLLLEHIQELQDKVNRLEEHNKDC